MNGCVCGCAVVVLFGFVRGLSVCSARYWENVVVVVVVTIVVLFNICWMFGVCVCVLATSKTTVIPINFATIYAFPAVLRARGTQERSFRSSPLKISGKKEQWIKMNKRIWMWYCVRREIAREKKENFRSKDLNELNRLEEKRLCMRYVCVCARLCVSAVR